MTLKPLIWWMKIKFFSWKLKKKDWMIAEMCLSFSSVQWKMNVHWKVIEQCLKSVFQGTFCKHSVDIQKCFSWLKGEFSSCGRCRTINPSLFKCQKHWTIFLFLQPFTDNDDVSIHVCVRYFSIWAPVFQKVTTCKFRRCSG